ncbi:MAG TPA: SDR family oxidoreductase [Acidimicrobiales bacterium]|nr:SDR family oxidoreductase [Acidimicrobiales bacterium]
MDLGLTGRVALVTASSKGLGRASAEALAGEGAAVVICARSSEALGDAEAAIRGRGGEVLAVPCDVTEEAVPARLVEATLERFGRLDIVVANAGGPPPMHALDVDDAALRKAVEANLLTSVRLVRAALPHLRERGWGRLCCIASFSVVQPIPGLALSNAARTGLWAWAKTAASDLRGSGITLNLACPGRHATERQVALGGAVGGGDPADFGRVVAFLCSEPASFVNGAAIVVDGGDTLAL